MTDDDARKLAELTVAVRRGEDDVDRLRERRDAFVVEKYREGVPATWLAEAMGIRRQSVYNILAVRGVPTRGRTGPPLGHWPSRPRRI